MKKLAKLLCLILCVLLFTSILFSVASAFYGHSHDCIGEDCQYCQAVSLHQEFMKLVFSVCFSASFALIFVQMLMTVSSCVSRQKQSVSLVASKVKLTT